MRGNARKDQKGVRGGGRRSLNAPFLVSRKRASTGAAFVLGDSHFTPKDYLEEPGTHKNQRRKRDLKGPFRVWREYFEQAARHIRETGHVVFGLKSTAAHLPAPYA